MSFIKTMVKPFLMLILISCLSLSAYAQSTVKGTVTDEIGEPVVGATVRVDGTDVGTITDLNGAFSVSASPQATLSISYVGFQPQKVRVAGRQQVSVVLKEDSETLRDVVVVGYGTMKKSDISGSVATIDQDAVMKRVPTNSGQALLGAAAVL